MLKFGRNKGIDGHDMNASGRDLVFDMSLHMECIPKYIILLLVQVGVCNKLSYVHALVNETVHHLLVLEAC